MSPTRLLLIDGTAILYRGFFAIRDLATKDHRPTNAVFGFIRMIQQLAEVWQPSHWLVALDGGIPQVRRDLLEGYKAQRPAMPEALKAQIQSVQEYMEIARVPWIRQSGEEADDVLASVAGQAQSCVGSMLIATSDKDFFQLVDEKCRVVPLAGKAESLDPAGVKHKTGVWPEQIVEWLALTGDSSDNIPGVPGVGAKTAAKLLEQFGSLANMWQDLDSVSNVKIRHELSVHREAVERNVRLVRLNRNLAVQPGWEQLVVQPPNVPGLLSFFESLELHTLARDLRQGSLNLV